MCIKCTDPPIIDGTTKPGLVFALRGVTFTYFANRHMRGYMEAVITDSEVIDAMHELGITPTHRPVATIAFHIMDYCYGATPRDAVVAANAFLDEKGIK